MIGHHFRYAGLSIQDQTFVAAGLKDGGAQKSSTHRSQAAVHGAQQTDDGMFGLRDNQFQTTCALDICANIYRGVVYRGKNCLSRRNIYIIIIFKLFKKIYIYIFF